MPDTPTAPQGEQGETPRTDALQIEVNAFNAVIDLCIGTARDVAAPFPSPTADEIIRALESLRSTATPPSGDREAVLALRELVRLKGERDALDAIDAKGWSREQSRLLSKSTREMSAAWEAARTALKHKDTKS